jgi:ABC-2 type transport system permease protein
MKKILTVIRFEYRGYITSSAFRVATILFVALIGIMSFLPQIIGFFENISSGGDKPKAALVLIGGADASIVDAQTLNGMDLGYEWESSGESAEKLVAEGKFKAAVEYGGGNAYTVYGLDYDFGINRIVSTLNSFFTEANRIKLISEMSDEKASGAQEALEAAVSGEVKTVGGGSASGNYWIGYVMIFILYMAVMMFSQMVSSAVISEKTSKAMEIMIVSAKPSQLMFGKVIGVGCAGLTQIGLIIAFACAGFALNLSRWEADMPAVAQTLQHANLSFGLFAMFILFFLLGYFTYAFIHAGLASTVSRIEDSGSVVGLPVVLIVASLMAGMFGMQSADSALIKVLSFLPPFSAFVMLGRMTMGSAGYLEGIASVLILVAAVVGLGIMASKIYRFGVTMYGKPMKLGEIIKVLFQRD